jgi:hypothetical protein
MVALYKAISNKALKIRSGFCIQQAANICERDEREAHHIMN